MPPSIRVRVSTKGRQNTGFSEAMNKEFLLSSNYQMKSKVLDLLLAPHTHNRVKPVSRINPASIRTILASVKIV
jgi:hypothetical protein